MKQYVTPLPNQPSERAKDFFNAAIDTIANLYGRWQDEKEYEDIKDYQLPLKKFEQEFGVTITKMNKRPFGFNFTTDNRNFVLTVKANGSVGYSRIAA